MSETFVETDVDRFIRELRRFLKKAGVWIAFDDVEALIFEYRKGRLARTIRLVRALRVQRRGSKQSPARVTAALRRQVKAVDAGDDWVVHLSEAELRLPANLHDKIREGIEFAVPIDLSYGPDEMTVPAGWTIDA